MAGRIQGSARDVSIRRGSDQHRRVRDGRSGDRPREGDIDRVNDFLKQGIDEPARFDDAVTRMNDSGVRSDERFEFDLQRVLSYRETVEDALMTRAGRRSRSEHEREVARLEHIRRAQTHSGSE